MSDEWNDINALDGFKDHHEFNDFVVVVDDGEDGEYTDIAFGIAQVPKETKRFFCIPCDEQAQF